MNKPLNCIFIGCFLYPHGYAATRRKQQFIDYIVKQGDSVRVLLTLKWARGHELNDIKGEHKGIFYEVVGDKVKPNLFFPFTFLRFLFVFCRRLLEIKNPRFKNIIVAFGINWDTVIPLLFAKLIGYHIVFDIVEDFSTLKPKKNLKRIIQHWIRTTLSSILTNVLVDGITVISNHIYEKHSHVSAPLKIVPISAENLNQLRLKNEKAPGYTFLYSGTFGEKEGLDILFAAFNEINKRLPDTRLVLTGQCPERMKNSLLCLLDNPNSVFFTGRLNDDEYYEQLNAADVMMMTRTNSAFANAGFPYKLGEYLATANPVICTQVSDIEYYLQDMDSALLIEPDNFNSLIDAMQFCYDHPEESKRIGRNGRKVCETHFNPDTNSRRFYELLQVC